MNRAHPELDHIAIVDLETGGLDHWRQPILTLAIHRPEPHLKTKLWHIQEAIEVRERCDPEALKKNGLSLDDVLCPTWGLPPHIVAQELCNALDPLRDDIGRVYLVAHNASFEALWLDRLFRVAGMQPPQGLIWVCSMSWALALRWGKGGHGRYSMGGLCAKYGVDHPLSHTADGDAEALGRLMPHLLDAIVPRSGSPASHADDEGKQELLF